MAVTKLVLSVMAKVSGTKKTVSPVGTTWICLRKA